MNMDFQEAYPSKSSVKTRVVSVKIRVLSNVVGARSNATAASGPVGVKKFAARLVHPFIGVRAEVVALRLQQVGRQTRAAIAVVKRQRRREGRRRHAALNGVHH